MKVFRRKSINRVAGERSRETPKTHEARDSGFTLTEILAAVGIVGILSAIAVPVTLSQQAKAADVTTRSDLTSAASAIESALLTWRGAPIEGSLNICHNEVTYPSESAPEYGCQPEEWVATVASNAALTNPPLGGKLSPGVTMTGRISATGAYCITATNSRFGSTPFYLDSDTSQVNEGTCYTAGWVDPSEGMDGPGITPEPELPAAPTGLSVNVASNVATVSWNGEANVTYAVSVSSQPIKTLTASTDAVQTCVFPATQCSGPSIAYLPTGTYTATVRAQGEAGWGPGATIDFGVTTMPPGGPDGGTPEQITTVFGSDALYAVLFGASTTSQDLQNYITTPAGRQDFERLMFSAPQTVLNSSVAMNKVVGAPLALEIVILDPPVFGAYTISASAMRAILGNSTALDKVLKSSTAMSLVATSRSAMSALASSSDGMDEVILSDVAMNEIANSSVAVFQVLTSTVARSKIVGYEPAINRFVESQTAMNTLVTSSEAMSAFANSTGAMNALTNSFSAMNAIATSSSARAAIVSSPTAMVVVNAKTVAIGKFTAGAAGLDPSQYGDMAAIISSPVAMNSVAASSPARGFIAGSDFAMSLLKSNEMAVGKYVAGMVGLDPTLVAGASGLSGFNLTQVHNNTEAWELVTRSEAGMQALAASRASMETVATNQGMYSDLLSQTASLNAIASSEPARTAFLGSQFTAGIIKGQDTTYVAKFLAGAAGLSSSELNSIGSMGDLTGNSNYWQRVVASPLAINTLAVSPIARSQVTGTARTTLYGSTMAVGKLMVADAINESPAGYDNLTQVLTSGIWGGIVTRSPSAMVTLSDSPTTVAALAVNGTAMAEFAESPEAINALLNGRPLAVQEIVKSSTAMDAISAKANSREKFFNDDYALSEIRKDVMALGKFTAGWVPTLTPAGFADMSALANNRTAMEGVAGTTKAVEVISQSQSAMQIVSQAENAADELAKSKTAMDILRDSQIAMSNMAAYAPAITAISISQPGLDSIRTSKVAMDAIASSKNAMDIYAISDIAMSRFVGAEQAMTSLSANGTVSRPILYGTGAELGKTEALKTIRTTSIAAAKFAMGLAGLSYSKIDSIANSTALAADQPAMAAIANNSAAMYVIAESTPATIALAADPVAAAELIKVTDANLGIHAFLWSGGTSTSAANNKGYAAMMIGSSPTAEPTTALYAAVKALNEIEPAKPIAYTAIARNNAELLAQGSNIPARADALGVTNAGTGRLGLTQTGMGTRDLYSRAAFSLNLLVNTTRPAITKDIWLDHSDPNSNRTTAINLWCIAVNYLGYTVYQNQSGPVQSCSAQTTSVNRNVLGTPIAGWGSLGAPSASPTISNAELMTGQSTNLTPPTGTLRAEWLFDDGAAPVATTGTNATTKTYTNTNDVYGASGNLVRTVRLVATTARGEAINGTSNTVRVGANFSHMFTNCGQTGRTGPALSTCQSAYGAAYNFNTDTNRLNTSNGTQLWTVPETGTYRITAAGAQGGANTAYSDAPGLGALMRGDFTLTKGQVVRILVGQQGLSISNSCAGAGGGGGTFVTVSPYSTDASILVVAGGGGGVGTATGSRAGIGGTTSTSGTASNGNNTAGGTGGNGGAQPPNTACSIDWVAGSGAGFYTCGAGPAGGVSASGDTGGGFSIVNSGGLGGDIARGIGGQTPGFGGGGIGNYGAGGGGGYSGGGGGQGTSCSCNTWRGGGGGGSYNNGTNQSNTAAANSGNGYVTITRIS